MASRARAFRSLCCSALRSGALSAVATVTVGSACGTAPAPAVVIEPAGTPERDPAPPPPSNGGPMYKPSSSSPHPVDISTNAYGAFSAAPDAPATGDVAADFVLPLADGGEFSLAQARKAGPVLVMFYRGFW